MKKKSVIMAFGIILSLAVVIGLMPVTSSAAELSKKFSSALDFEVDFRTGSDEDTTGNWLIQSDLSDDAIYENDADLKQKVAIFGFDVDCGGMVYDNAAGESMSGYDLTDGVTLETFIYLTPGEEGNVAFMETSFGCLHLQQYNSGEDKSVGFRCGDAPGASEPYDGNDPSYNMRNAYMQKTLPTGKWVHLVGVSDGETNKFYLDGKLMSSVDRQGNILVGVNKNTDTKMYLGNSAFAGMFDMVSMEGKMAFARMYKAAATEDDVAAMLANATDGAVIPSHEDEATEEPTEEPTAKPTVKPAPTNAPVSESKSGIPSWIWWVAGGSAVVIAAVVVVLIIVMKKKKTSDNKEDNK